MSTTVGFRGFGVTTAGDLVDVDAAFLVEEVAFGVVRPQASFPPLTATLSNVVGAAAGIEGGRHRYQSGWPRSYSI